MEALREVGGRVNGFAAMGWVVFVDRGGGVRLEQLEPLGARVEAVGEQVEAGVVRANLFGFFRVA